MTGYVQDMKLIGNFVRENNLLLIVDVSQSAGCIPVDADSWRADGVIFTGHKSLWEYKAPGAFHKKGAGAEAIEIWRHRAEQSTAYL